MRKPPHSTKKFLHSYTRKCVIEKHPTLETLVRSIDAINCRKNDKRGTGAANRAIRSDNGGIIKLNIP